MKVRCSLFLISAVFLIACTTAEQTSSHKLTKRQLPRASAQRAFPLSRSRQFPPPEELEPEDEVEEEINEPLLPVRRSQFRGRQQPADEPEDLNEEYSDTESPPTSTTSTAKPSNRISAFNRAGNRPRFGGNVATTARPTAAPALPPAPARTRSRSQAAPAQRIDVVSDILNRTPPPRATPRTTPAPRTTTTKDSGRKPVLDVTSSTVATRRVGTGSRNRPRGRLRTRTSTTTTTTTTTTTAPPEDYYYYYYDDEEEAKQAQATTTSTTTTTTTPKPSLPRRPSLNRGRATNTRTVTSARPAVKFDPESQFQPPPDDTVPEKEEVTRSTKRFTTSTTEATPPGGIPPHLRGKYKERTDGRFVDYLRDPNRPRELKGFDLTDYPFYIRVPEDIVFDCEDKKDGYYASVPHHCQLFHYCFAGSRYDFLCANYTLYDQTTFTCRFANNVDCPSSEKFYYRNDDLWKETTTIPPEEQKKKKVVKEPDYEEEEEDYDEEEYYDDEEEDDKRRRRPSRRRRNRRKNRRKPAE